jgi:hypothetical protein
VNLFKFFFNTHVDRLFELLEKSLFLFLAILWRQLNNHRQPVSQRSFISEFLEQLPEERLFAEVFDTQLHPTIVEAVDISLVFVSKTLVDLDGGYLQILLQGRCENVVAVDQHNYFLRKVRALIDFHHLGLS